MEDNVKEPLENEFTQEPQQEATEQKVEESCENGQDQSSTTAEDQTVQELAEMKDKYLRLNAEFDNFRRRNAKERVELMQTANKEVIRELLDVLDDCDRTEENLNKKDVELKAVKEGVQLVFNKLRKVLENKGLKAFDSKEKEFDVELHEAITEIPAPKKKLKGKVVDEIQKGYNLNGNLIRHAKVVVGK